MRNELKLALTAYAKAVRKVLDLSDIVNPDPVTDYHLREYTQPMEEMLMEQLLTATDNPDEADGILCGCGLDFLIEDLHIRAQEWDMEQ